MRARIVAARRRFGLVWPRVGRVDFGSLRKLVPISTLFALDRGFPVERYYIEKFLAQHAGDIRGRVLEMGDSFYTDKFGGGCVTGSDVMSVVDVPGATIVADLTDAGQVADGTFDCIILTQTLQMIYKFESAVRELSRILAPGGVLLVTTHGISRVGRHEGVDFWGEYWRFTSQSARRLFAGCFGESNVRIEGYGNVLAACAALHGLASEELTADELDTYDPCFDVIIGVRAVKR